ncbi:hypothetical protein [Salinimicrobium sp. GXAS 041]
MKNLLIHKQVGTTKPAAVPHAVEIKYFLGNLSRNENFTLIKDI